MLTSLGKTVYECQKESNCTLVFTEKKNNFMISIRRSELSFEVNYMLLVISNVSNQSHVGTYSNRYVILTTAPDDGFICGVKTCSLNTFKSYIGNSKQDYGFFHLSFKAAYNYISYNQ